MPGGGLGARGQQKTKKEDLFDKQMETYMQQRASGMPPPVTANKLARPSCSGMPGWTT
jgi:hypothetical protein